MTIEKLYQTKMTDDKSSAQLCIISHLTYFTLLMEGKAVKVIDAAVKPQAINQLLLILNAAHHVAVLWPWVKQEKSAISCCLRVGASKLIIEMQNPSSSGPEPCRPPHSVVSEESDRPDTLDEAGYIKEMVNLLP